MTHKQTGRSGVLKLPQKLTHVAVERFHREVNVILSLKHAAIVKLLDHSLDPEGLGYVSPLGMVLPDFWKAQNLEPSSRYDLAYEFMRSIAEGLAAVHDADVVHRDLKPENVIVLKDGTKPQPVVIDFGLAIRPSDERLSVLDERVVANKIAAPGAAYYGHIIEPAASWDVIGLGWLYGILVGDGITPLNNRFHWKYHPLVLEQRAPRVKALLAICSDVDTAPKNAHGFLSLMDNLGLGPAKPREEHNKPDFSAASRARLDAIAAEEQRRAEMAERVKISVAGLAPILDEVRRGLNEAMKDTGDMPIELNNFNTSPQLAAITMEEHLLAAFRRGVNGDPAVIFSATCGRYRKRIFNICVFIHHQESRFGQQPFCFRIWCAHDDGKFNKQPYLFFENDGAIVDSAEGEKKTLKPSDVVKMVVDMITDPAHWKFAS